LDQRIQRFAPFPLRWFSFELQGYRPSRSTYDFYPYDDLPPLPEDQFTGKLQWLVPLDSEIDILMQPYRFPAELQAEWHPRWVEHRKEIVASAQQLGLCLPPAFLRFMASTELQDRIPSGTDCWFLFSSIVPCPRSRDGYIIRFLQDNQGCSAWYLYLSPDGKECVLTSGARLHLLVTNPEQLGNISEEEEMEHTYVCAPSFEAFLYRFWIENVLAFNLDMRKPLTEEQQQYLSYYEREKDER
jgi:hypothetical protein